MKKDDYFVRIPISILRNESLTRSSILVYAVLLDAADCYGMQFIGIDELARRCRISPATVRRSERQLVEAGLITIARTGRESLIGIVGMQSMLRQVSGYDAYNRSKKEA